MNKVILQGHQLTRYSVHFRLSPAYVLLPQEMQICFHHDFDNHDSFSSSTEARGTGYLQRDVLPHMNKQIRPKDLQILESSSSHGAGSPLPHCMRLSGGLWPRKCQPIPNTEHLQQAHDFS